MPIYMDRHDVSEEVTAEIVADLHQKDLKIQHQFDCKALTYWFDAKRKTAFCLVEAPDKKAIQEMHDFAHGVVAHRIIEVDGAIVESFLGRIEDPEKSQKTELNIINDPTFRIIMVAEIKAALLEDSTDKRVHAAINHQNRSIVRITDQFEGRVVKRKVNNLLISFDSVTHAVLCALESQDIFKKLLRARDNPPIQLKIGLCGGAPVSEKEGFFEDTIQMAERLCGVVKGQIVVSSEVKDLYESENLNISIGREYINALSSNDGKFLNLLMDYTDREWSNPTLNVDDFSRNLGYSKSQLYRKMIFVTGKSPNSFIRAFRLKKALQLLNKHSDNISEVAYEVGFNSPAYFSKCFQHTFGIRPSTYIRQVQLQSLLSA